MGHLLHLFAALAVLALAELGWAEEPFRPVACALALALPHALAGVARVAARRARSSRVAAWIAHSLGGVPLAAFAAITLAFGWHGFVERVAGPTGLLEWPRPASLLAFAPWVLLECLGIDARARTLVPRGPRRTRLRRFQWRMLAAALAPLALWLGASFLVGLGDTIRVEIEEVALFNVAFAALLLFVLALALPRLLCLAWDTRPLEPGPLRDLLEDVARRSGFRCRDLREWRTGGLMANAAVIGFGARHRIVLLSDALLDLLPPRELAAVLGHEMGHARRHHVLVFVAWSLAFFLGADVLASELGLVESGPALLVFGAALVVWALGFGWLSRRFELDADLAGLEVTGDPVDLILALERVGGGFHRRRTSWRHFSVAERVAFLTRAAGDPSFARRFRRRLVAFAIAGVTLAAVAVVGEARLLASTFEADRVVADLRLGRYARAEERLEAGAEVEEPVARLVDRAARAPADATGPAAWLDRARARLAEGDLVAAVECVELARLRGDGEALPPEDWIRALVADDPARARALLEEIAVERAGAEEGGPELPLDR